MSPRVPPTEIAPVERPTRVDPNQPAPFLPEVTRFLRVGEARARFRIDGAGLTAAVLDTGLNVTHVDFADRIAAQANFTPDNGGDVNDATDGNGHGTNVAGIIAARGDHIGLAPGARVFPLKVLRDAEHGGGSFAWVDEALERVIDGRAQHNISVVCMSLGSSENHTDDDYGADPLRAKIRILRALRVPVVIAAGNDYFRHNSRQGMAYPAILRECISVGAVFDDEGGRISYRNGAVAFTTHAGQITPFSQRLHPTVSRSSFTDIFAPGAPVTSSGIGGPHETSTQHGTSQAAPATVGIILLLQQFHLRVTEELPSVEDLITWLREGGQPIMDGDDENDNVQHTGLSFVRADALGSLELCAHTLAERGFQVP